MNVKCRYCRSKYRMTKAAYDDIEYLGVHTVKCKYCRRSFSVKIHNFRPVVVK